MKACLGMSRSRAVLACNLRQRQLPQEAHLKKRCKLCANLAINLWLGS